MTANTRARAELPASHAQQGDSRALIPATASALIDDGVRIVRDYAALHNRETTILKKLADVIVRLRACYVNGDGKPDLRGTSQDYKDAVQALYRKADVSADSKSNVQAAVRYHISRSLREYMREQGYTSGDFAYYQLSEDDAAERNRRRARERTARARQATALLAADVAPARQPDLPSLLAPPGPRNPDAEASRPEPEDYAAALVALVVRLRDAAGDREALVSLARLKHDRRAELREALDALDATTALVRSYL